MTNSQPSRDGKYRRAKLRHAFLTKGADKILGGRLTKAHDRQVLNTTRLEVPMTSWPLAWDGLRIGHLSDIHYGSLMTAEKCIAAIDQLAAEKPHIVVFTGDMIDLDCGLDAQPVFDALANMNPPLGVFMVMGNHDYLDNGPLVRQMAIKAGIQVLDEETVAFQRSAYDLPGVGDGSDAELRVSGIDWGRTVKELSPRVEEVSKQQPHLLLAHNPKAFLPASSHGIPLTLAGHTHGGQVATPKKPGINLALAMMHRLNAGLYTRKNSSLFVTVGVGSLFPLRVHCPAEVVVLTAKHLGT
jgi:predicted MPP superfamily phosphohydrolase